MAGLVTISGACAITVGVGWDSPVRTVLAIAFLMLVPGLAIVELLGISDLALRLTVATGVSLAIDGLVSMVLLYARIWSPGLALAILIGISGAALAGATARTWPRQPAGRLP